MSKENHTQTSQGSELFDNYLSIKKALTTKIKSVLDIMAQCNSLDVTPDDAIKWVSRDTTKVSSHQWRYNSGHETIYCDHMYDFRGSFSRKCTVKIPAKYLEMSDDEILKENYEAAIKSMEAQREVIETRITNANKPLIAEIDKINKRIESLKGMVVKDENVCPEHPMKVFVFGSSTIDILTAEMLEALHELIKTYHPEFLIGDCYGADNLIQSFLEDIDYTNVRIFCSGKEPRHAHFANVVSMWKDTGGKRGEEFQQVKDVAMTEECDIAIGFWDGTSWGTKANIDRCKKLGKPCKVFLTPLFQKSKETNPTNFV